MTRTSSNTTKPSFETRLRRIVVVAVITMILLPVVTFLVWRITLSMRVKAKLAAIAKAGYPVNLADLERMYYPEIKPEDNAAVFFTEAFTHIAWTNSPRQLTDLWRWGTLARGPGLFSAETNALISPLLRTNEELVLILRRTPAFEKSRYRINLGRALYTFSPHLTKIRTCMELILLDAAVRAHAGHADEAVQDTAAALRLSQSLANEPLLSSQLIRIRSRQMINSTLEHILTEAHVTDLQLRDLINAVQREENPQAMEHALAGERCFGIYFHQRPAEAVAAFPSDPEDHDSPAEYKQKVTTGFRLFKAIGLLDVNLNYYLDIMSKRVSLTKGPYPERITVAKQFDQQLSNTPPRLYHLYADVILPPGLGRLPDRQAADAARFEFRQTALAVERFRLAKQDQLPGKLGDLVPAFLPAVPMDPFDGQPLRFEKLDKGYVIYSIGPDGTDDGGKEWQPRAKGSNKDAPYDITFTVER